MGAAGLKEEWKQKMLQVVGRGDAKVVGGGRGGGTTLQEEWKHKMQQVVGRGEGLEEEWKEKMQ